jgi:drug/metabolite transporter (DMT)-like permease
MTKLRGMTSSMGVQVVAAFAAVYLIWGSTYLAIRLADETMPPFIMASARFLIAGGFLYGWLRLRGTPRPLRIHWKSAIIIGGLLLAFGNGFVSWAELQVPSSLAAVMVAMVPLWMALLDWLRPGGTRPSAGVLVGLAIGFGGVALLVTQGNAAGGTLTIVGVGTLIVATICWASGSLYARNAALPKSPLMGTATEMLAGGAILLVFATVTGEWGQLNVERISTASSLALAYLIVFGSLVAFTAYVWLLRNVSSARVSTYAYVNPAVAVFLGWALASEQITLRTLLATAVIIGAVALITAARTRQHTVPEDAAPTSEAADNTRPALTR